MGVNALIKYQITSKTLRNAWSRSRPTC